MSDKIINISDYMDRLEKGLPISNEQHRYFKALFKKHRSDFLDETPEESRANDEFVREIEERLS